MKGGPARQSFGSNTSDQSETVAWIQEDWKWNGFAMTAAPIGPKTPPMLSSEDSGLLGAAALRMVRARKAQQRVSENKDSDSEAKEGPVCQVEDCGEELTDLKEYHNRYRICEFHLKVPSIVRGGVVQRFCQQCGRFHDLGAFDSVRSNHFTFCTYLSSFHSFFHLEKFPSSCPFHVCIYLTIYIF